MMVKLCPRKHGSILIEALLTIIILSVGLTVIIQSLTSSLRTLGLVANYSTAILLGENKIFDFIQKGFIKASFKEEKNFSEGSAAYRYQLDVHKIPQAPATDKKNEVVLAVSWGAGSKEKSIALTTYLFDESHESSPK